jgi:hypothetical protein
MSADIAGQELSVATVQGSELSINATDGVKVNDANVVQADIGFLILPSRTSLQNVCCAPAGLAPQERFTIRPR